MEKKLKLIWFTSYPGPYRTDFFNELGKYYELILIHENRRYDERNDKWFKDDITNYKAYYLFDFNSATKRLKFIVNILKDREVKYVINSSYTQKYGMFFTRVSKLLRKTLIIEADGGIPNPSKLIKFIVTNEFRKFDYFLSSSKYTDDYFKYYGVKEELIHRFNFTSLSENDLKLNSNIRLDVNKPFKILSIGQMVHRKGFDILIDSLKNIDNIECKIIGGKPNNELLEQISDLKLDNIEFIDFLSKEELSKYYKEADLFVFPTREDIWGLVINEALSFNLPYISSDNCVAAKHFLDIAECGLLFENENPIDLRERIIYIKNNLPKLNEMRKNTKTAIQNSTIEQMVQDHIQFINKIVTKE